MNISRVFVLRPVATSLLTAGVLLSGAVAYTRLPISALPQVDYPTMQVLTLYPGASPDVMASSVTAPLERQFGQMPGLDQMTSTSSFGCSVITLRFSLDLNLDVAEQEVQAAINAGSSFLPRDLPSAPVYSKTNPADAPILSLALTSDELPLSKVQDLADTRLAQKISQVSGVGLVSITGGQKPAVRVQVNPTALGSYDLSLEDVRTAIASANVNQAKGSFDGPSQAYTIGANDQLISSHDYAPLVVAYRNGAPVRLSDVADVVDGVENANQAAWMNTTPAVILSVQRQPGANIIAVVDDIKALLPRLTQTLPPTVHTSIVTDRTTTIRASVRDVQFELMLTVGLVVAVMFLFLRTMSATVIPSVALPLSLVGTLGVMYLLGYSLDNLSLMARRLASDCVHHPVAHGVAHRGPHPAVVDGRCGGAAVSRVRDYAWRHDPRVGGRVAHPDAHDVLETSSTKGRGSAREVPRAVATLVRRGSCRLRPHAAVGPRSPDVDAPGGRRDARRNARALRGGAKGVFPFTGYGRDSRCLRSA